jgi:hypothetical protein
MAANREEVIEKIEKIMRRTHDGSGASEAEVEQALAYARKLMDQFQIDLAEVLEANKEELSDKDITSQQLETTVGTFQTEICRTACDICDAKFYFANDVVLKKGKYSRVKKYVIYGMTQDVIAARCLFLELMLAVKALGKAKYGTGSGKEFWTYCGGFAVGLRDKARSLKHSSDTAVKPSSCTTLIVRKTELIRSFQATLGLRPSRMKGYGSGRQQSDAFGQGYRDGQEYDASPDRSRKLPRENRRLS